jgi:hypothetical protein
MRLRALLALMLAIGLLAGCGPSFTYNHLDRLIPWYVDGYVDLTRDQRQILQGQLEPLLQWHREEELVAYIALLNRIESDLESPVAAEDVRGWIHDITAAVERTEASMLKLALDFGATLSDAQMQEFIESLRERQREYEEEFLGRSEAEYREESYESLVDVLERFLGRLQSGQKEQLQSAVAGLDRFDSAWLEDRAQWLDRLAPLLQRAPGWQRAVEAAYSARRDQRSPRYTRYLEHNLGLILPAVAAVLNERTAAQGEHMAEEFDSLRGKLRKLAGAAASAPAG